MYGVDAVTLSNRSLQILTYGIPIITKKMKYTLKIENVIFTYNSNKDLIKKLNFIQINFNDFQNEITEFIEKNNEESRYQKLFSILKFKKNSKFISK